MALKPCKGCGKAVDTTAKACPGCGRPHPTTSSGLKAIVFVVLVGALFLGGRSLCGEIAESERSARRSPEVPGASAIEKVMNSATEQVSAGLNRQVIDDSVKQYEISKRSGTKIDACVHAGVVAAAFLQAKDEDGYTQWKATEKKDCTRAGMPGM